MVCKAIIQEIISNYKVRVRVPTFHRGEESIGATPSLDTPTATICIPPSIYPSLRKNDIVWVDFEDDNVDKPVVMGILYSSSCYNTKSDVKGTNLEVDSSATLPTNTSIGTITPENIEKLSGIAENIQKAITDKDTRLKKIESEGCSSLLNMLQELSKGINDIVNK